MKKKPLLSLIFLFLAQVSFSTPVHLIGGKFGIAISGGKEITDIFPSISVNNNIYSYNAGLEYDFRFIPSMSIGAGCNYILKSYIVDFTAYQRTFNYNVLEPYGIIRGYLQIIKGIDLFADAGVGYSFLIGSKVTENPSGLSAAVSGSKITYKFGGGFTYEGSGFITMLEGGYKIATISPLNATGDLYSGKILNVNGSSAVVNVGGPFVNIFVFLAFGNNQEQKTNVEIKEQIKKDVSKLKIEESVNEQTYQKTGEDPSNVAEKQESISPVELHEQKQTVEIRTNLSKTAYEPIEEDDTEGIIILSPGELETAELEKYIASKRKQIIPEEEETQESEEIEFDYDQTNEVLLVEAEAKGKVEKAGYVLVERAGFISNNFTEDGFIFTKEKEKMFLTPNNFAYIRLTVGKGARRGKEFVIYDDGEEVMDNISGQPMGKMINILGVAKVVKHVENNIFKVQIKKAYAPIKNEMKIKVRNDIKDYHKTLLKKIKKKNLDVEGYIVKVQKDMPGIKNKDIVYLNLGITKGILPGEKLNIYRRIFNPSENKEEKFHKIGSLIVINSVQYSSVGLITQQDEIIKIGDIVKTK